MSDFPASKHITTDDFLQPRNDGITARDGHRLALKSSSSPAPHAKRYFWCWKLFVAITVAWDDLGMGGIASFPLHQWDEMVPTSAQLVSLKRSLLCHEKLPQPLDIWWSNVTLHPVWQHDIFVVPSTIRDVFQAPAAMITPPSPEYLWDGS